MNAQRERFKGEVEKHMKQTSRDRDMEHAGEERHMDAEHHTRIEHHEDGTHTVHHHDGETSGPHPSMAHAAMHLAAKHDGGEHGHIMPHPGGGATTHHVGMDGEVQGPHEHQSEDEGYEHLASNIGEGSDMGDGVNSGASDEGSEEDTNFA